MEKLNFVKFLSTLKDLIKLFEQSNSSIGYGKIISVISLFKQLTVFNFLNSSKFNIPLILELEISNDIISLSNVSNN